MFFSEVSHLTVIAGEYDRTAIDDEQQDIPVSSVKIHPKYRPDGSMTYDIALLYLSKPIILGEPRKILVGLVASRRSRSTWICSVMLQMFCFSTKYRTTF